MNSEDSAEKKRREAALQVSETQSEYAGTEFGNAGGIAEGLYSGEQQGTEEALRQYAERLKTMQEIDRAILVAQSAQEISQIAFRHLRKLVPCQRVTLVLGGIEDREATVLALDVDGEHNAGAEGRLQIESFGEVGDRIKEAFLKGESYILDVESLPQPPPAIQALQKTGRRYFVIVPLLAHSKLMGSLSLGMDDMSNFTAEHMDIVREVANSLAIAVQQAHLHEQIKRHTEELERRVAERTAELEAFSYSISHDLRAPLLTIDGFSRALLEEYAGRLDEEGQRMLNIISASSQSMGQLIDALLAFSRLGCQKMKLVEIDMQELAGDVFEELKAMSPARNLQFTLGRLPSAYGDRAMMRQVFVNLLSNALKFTALNETAVIDIGAMEEADHNVYYVKDNGAGFDMKHAGKLFTVFQRLHPEEQFPGSGVGLAFVQRIVTRHGGRVWLESAVNEGTTAYFTMPRKEERTAANGAGRFTRFN